MEKGEKHELTNILAWPWLSQVASPFLREREEQSPQAWTPCYHLVWKKISCKNTYPPYELPPSSLTASKAASQGQVTGKSKHESTILLKKEKKIHKGLIGLGYYAQVNQGAHFIMELDLKGANTEWKILSDVEVYLNVAFSVNLHHWKCLTEWLCGLDHS